MVDLMGHVIFTMGHGKFQHCLTYGQQNETCDICDQHQGTYHHYNGTWCTLMACMVIRMLQWISVVNSVEHDPRCHDMTYAPIVITCHFQMLLHGI